MFKIGQSVVYRSEGVCKIVDIREESFGVIGVAHKYYILSPVNDMKSTLFVPVDNETLTSFIRPVLSVSELGELLKSLEEETIELPKEARARHMSFRDILAIGDRRELILLVKTMSEYWKQGNRVLGTDINDFDRAKHMLYNELSYSLELDSEDDVVQLVLGKAAPISRTGEQL